MAKATKLPSGNWRVQLYCGKDENGKRIMESFTAPTKREAERLAANFDGDRKRRAADRAAGRIQLAEAMDTYIETCRATNRSPATIRGYCSIRRRFGSLLAMHVNAIRVQDVQKAVNEWSASGLSPKSIRNRIGLFTSTLGSLSITLDLSSLKLPAVHKKEMVIPEDTDVQRMVAYLREKDTDLFLAVLLAATLGLRRSEICALEWSDIDFKAGTLSITKAVVRGDDNLHHTKITKTRAGTRTLFIAPDVLAELKKYRQINKKVVNVTPETVTKRYIRLKKKMNVPGRFHDLRHYMASVMAALNVPIKYAVEIMGHSTPNMLNNVYQHVMEKKRDAVYQLIDTHSAQIVSGEKIEY